MFGKFDQVLSLYTPAKSISAAGEPVLVYTFAFKILAAVESLETAEAVRNDSIINLPRIKVTTHYQTAINTGQRLVYSGKNYNITDIKEINRRFLEIAAIIEEV